MTKLPKPPLLKQKQREILILLYRFRFLNRIHIQTLLNHRHHRQILAWLNDLVKRTCAKQYYEKQFAGPSAVYSLGIQARKYLKHNQNIETVELPVLNRIWREGKLTVQFRNHCLALADIYLSLQALTAKNGAALDFRTKTDLYGMAGLISPAPDAYIAISEKQGEVKRYFLDLLEDIPAAVLRGRVKRYFDYYESNEWQEHTGKPFPEIILICPNERLKKHLYRYIQHQLQDEPELNFYLSTRDLVAKEGLQSSVLQRVIIKD